MQHPVDLFSSIGILPVIAIDRVEDAVALADALLEGGLPIAEITFRTKAAAEVIDAMRQRRPELCVGAGTVLDEESLEAAVKSGARFGLAPGFDGRLVSAANSASLPFFPGVMTPSDLSGACRMGVRVMKFFPAAAAGGQKFLDAISAPFAHLGPRFIPTGGVRLQNMEEWLRIPNVVCVGGTWIATSKDIRDGAFKKITNNAREAVEMASRIREGAK
jgi:2-dehydro-3-deoxyphosphogluconate aldolase / (4S)-4-hydroxy-2-oxoglutarate aldolase